MVADKLRVRSTMRTARRTDRDRWSLRFAPLAAAALGCAAGLSLVVANAAGTRVRSHAAAKASTGVQHRAAPPAGTIVHGFNDNNQAEGKIANLTPYTWTFVAKGRNNSDVQTWDSDFPAVLQPGQSFTYRLKPYGAYATTHEYNGFFTYKADTVNHPEYLTVDLEGTHCTGICLPRDGPALVPKAFNATAAPTHNNVFDLRLRPGDAQPGDRLDHGRLRQRLAAQPEQRLRLQLPNEG